MTNHNTSKPAGSILTTWRIWTFDVWGNAKDGYEVNNRYSHGTVELRIPQTRHNIGSSQEFLSASPSDRQIKRAFGVNCRVDTDGDDLHIEVTRQRDGYPIGSMECVSHESLCPVRKKAGEL